MFHLDEIDNFKKLYEKHSQVVMSNLQEIVKQLIVMVDNHDIYSFEFGSNTVNAPKPDKIALFITTNSHKKIQLGIDKHTGNQDLIIKAFSGETLEKIMCIDEYVLFVNEHMQSVIPEVKRPTKYRLTNPSLTSDQPKVPNFAKGILQS